MLRSASGGMTWTRFGSARMPARHLDNRHPDIACQHTREHARAARIEVLDHDEGHARVIGQAGEELPQGLEAARRRADRDDRERRPHRVVGWVVGLLAHLASLMPPLARNSKLQRS